MAINIPKILGDAVKTGWIVKNDDDGAIIDNIRDQSRVTLVETDKGHDGFDQVVVEKRGEKMVFNWNSEGLPAGAFKRLSDYVKKDEGQTDRRALLSEASIGHGTDRTFPRHVEEKKVVKKAVKKADVAGRSYESLRRSFRELKKRTSEIKEMAKGDTETNAFDYKRIIDNKISNDLRELRIEVVKSGFAGTRLAKDLGRFEVELEALSGALSDTEKRGAQREYWNL